MLRRELLVFSVDEVQLVHHVDEATLVLPRPNYVPLVVVGRETLLLQGAVVVEGMLLGDRGRRSVDHTIELRAVLRRVIGQGRTSRRRELLQS